MENKSFNNILKDEIKNLGDDKKNNLIKNKLRERYLLNGYINDPKKTSQLEFAFKEVSDANNTLNDLLYFDISSKITIRNSSFIVYIKDRENIKKLLEILGAKKSLNEYKKIIKNRNANSLVQRQMNFEMANIKKVTDVSLKQIEEIDLVLKKYKKKDIDEKILKVMEIRKKYPLDTYGEIAKRIGNVTKSTISNRFKEIHTLALKCKRGDE